MRISIRVVSKELVFAVKNLRGISLKFVSCQHEFNLKLMSRFVTVAISKNISQA